MVRKRYSIGGDDCADCCIAYWCGPCTIQQILLEMAVRGDFPGACCYQIQKLPPTTNML